MYRQIADKNILYRKIIIQNIVTYLIHLVNNREVIVLPFRYYILQWYMLDIIYHIAEAACT